MKVRFTYLSLLWNFALMMVLIAVLLAGEMMLSAAQAGDVVLLQQLLDKGHSINETNYDCVTPLHEACLADRLECVKFLLLCGANVSFLLILCIWDIC